MKRSRGRGRRSLPPHGIDDLVGRDRASEVSEQIGENRALLGAWQLDWALCGYDLERTEDVKLHAPMLRRSPRLLARRDATPAIGRKARSSLGAASCHGGDTPRVRSVTDAPAIAPYGVRMGGGTSLRSSGQRERMNELAAQRLIDTIRDSVIGDGAVDRWAVRAATLVYADYTASGRALGFVEDFIRERRAAALREHAHGGVGDRTADDGAARGRAPDHPPRGRRTRATTSSSSAAPGSTGAIDKLVQVLGLRLPERLRLRHAPAGERPVVFVGPYEHHSNELPWRESIADVVTIREDADGRVDLDHLEHELRRYADRPLKIGSFSAASNVTGIVTDVDAVAIVLHRHGALACWDYAAAGPYLPIDMNPSPERRGRAPGVQGRGLRLAAQVRRRARHARRPGRQARAVRESRARPCPAAARSCSSARRVQSYHPRPDDPRGGRHTRDRGVDPRRARLRAQGGGRRRRDPPPRDELRAARARLLGREPAHRDPRQPRGSTGSRSSRSACVTRRRLLHSHFVVALLNDLFGIQARSGCFCAGPYIHRLYPIDDGWSARMDAEVRAGQRGREALASSASASTTSQRGRLRVHRRRGPLRRRRGLEAAAALPLRPESGLWHHRGGEPTSLSLHDVSFASGQLEVATRPSRRRPGTLADHLEEARRLVAAVEASPPMVPLDDPPLSEEFERGRWFPLPAEAVRELHELNAHRAGQRLGR